MLFKMDPMDATKTTAHAFSQRLAELFRHIDTGGVGLEIGPGYSPLLPKSEGFRVETLDHAPAEVLREKYANSEVDITKIEHVDFVWQGEPLDELTGRRCHYDFIVASHALEHTTDLVRFLQQCEAMLNPKGRLSLAIPDYRYCFDIFRGFTTTGDVLQAFIEKRKRHIPGTVFDHFSLATFLDGKPSWHRGADGALHFLHSFNEATAMYEKACDTSEYLDVHNWRFTPASFRLVLQDLRRLGLILLTEEIMFDTEGCEFIVTLLKSTSSEQWDRFELARTALLETRMT
jgi:SAM-dependent methyltransferase